MSSWARAVRGLLLLLLLLLVAAPGCGPAASPPPSHYLDDARAAAKGSSDPDRLGRWLLLELLSPSGQVKGARAARAELAKREGGGVDAWLARALEADVHGKFPAAAHAYVQTLQAVRNAARADAAIIGWFASSRINALESSVPHLYEDAESHVREMMASPGSIGWRARAELVEWWSRHMLQDAHGPRGDALLDAIADKHGCLREASMAGPFGRGVLSDHRVHFAAEGPAPWPPRFEVLEGGDERRPPEVLEVERHACLLSARQAVPAGIYYVQSFVDLPAARDVVLAVQGSYALFVDDHEVLRRDRGQWGVWPRYGVRLRLEAGRHRIVARLLSPETAIRVLGPSGEPLGLHGSAEQGAAYELSAPKRLAEPNALEPFLRAVGVPAPLGGGGHYEPLDTDHPLLRYLASYLAHLDAQDDLASVLLEPLVKDGDEATPLALAQQAVFVDGDPIFAAGVARDLARNLRQQAADGDAELWGPALWLVLERAEKADPAELVRDLEALVRRFEQVPMAVTRLANVYGQLGWSVEHLRTLENAAKLFPSDTDVLGALMEAYEEQGRLKDADALAERIQHLDPTSEIGFSRALARHDYKAAVAELERIGRLRKDRRDIAVRIADLLVRAGDSNETMASLELALERDAHDADARLALADARFARGEGRALQDALVEAIRTGSDDGALRSAIELVEGKTNLEPFRRDGMAIIRDTQQRGVELPGTAARILDYAALWIAPDGSARMLEHEIVKVQSREGIARHAEQQLPRGILLRMRTIKSDGRIFEPEIVAAKPTVTMPHLEVGDYIETESIWELPSTGRRIFRAPRWFFREENTSYHLSEFVVIAPSGRDLDVETTGQVPEPSIDRSPGLVVRRWKVEGSIALPEEPLSAPVQEFLPSVRVGWGVDLDEQLRDFIIRQSTDAVRDPRMVRVARSIVTQKVDAAAPKSSKAVSKSERARRIYRWVVENVEDGEERNPAKIITGKSGERTMAFLYLCRLAGLDARLGLVRDRLSPPVRGAFSKAETYNSPAVRVATEQGAQWLVVQDRFAPFGYLPSSLRDQPAVLIQSEKPITTTAPPAIERENAVGGGSDSGIEHEAKVTLRADGSASMKLVQRYRGRYAVQLRTVLNNTPESRRRDVIEAKLLGLALPGGHLESLKTPNLDRLDEPVELHMDVEVANFARTAQGELVLEVPFLGNLTPLVQLPERQTPLYISERIASDSAVSFRIELPKGARVASDLSAAKIDDDALTVSVHDRVDGSVLVVDRKVHIPAGRVQPEQYAAFKDVVTRADAALNRTIRLQL